MGATEGCEARRGTRSESYRSAAPSRLQQPSRQVAPIQSIAQCSPLPAEPSEARLAALEARLARLEQQQRALIANLHEAHGAFCRLGQRVGDLARRLEARRDGAEPPVAP